MKKSEDNKSKAFYDIESDKSKGIGLGNIAMGNAPIFTTNEKGEIEFEIEVPKAPEEVEDKKQKKHRWFKKNKKEEKEEPKETEEEPEETENNEEENEGGDFFKTLKTIIRILFITIIVIAVILVVWGLNSPTFNIKSIEINELNKVSKEDVLGIASGDMGNNIFKTNFGILKTKIEKLPYVYKVELSRNLPDVLHIEVTERKEILAISGDNDFLLLDQFGYVMSNESGDFLKVPIAYGLTQHNYSVGETLNGTDIAKFKNLKYFIEVADSINFEYKISNIDYSNSNNLKFRIDDLNINISYGEIDKNIASDKLIYLKEIIKTCVDNGFKGELDISSENYLSSAIFKKEI